MPITEFLIRATLACDCGSEAKTPCGSTWDDLYQFIYSLLYTFLITFQGSKSSISPRIFDQMRGWLQRQTLFSPVPPFFVGRNCLSAYSQSGQTVAAADRGQPAQNIMLRLLGYVSLAHLHIILVIYPPIIGLSVKSPQLPPVLSEIRNDFRSKCTP